MRKLLIILLAVALSAIGIAYYLDARIPRATATLQVHPQEIVAGVGSLRTGPG
jgi:Flp pilus assembly protein CpaB